MPHELDEPTNLPTLDKHEGVPGRGEQVQVQNLGHHSPDILGLKDAGN